MAIDTESMEWGFRDDVDAFRNTPTITKLLDSNNVAASYLISSFNSRADASQILPGLRSVYLRALSDMKQSRGER